MKQVSTRNESLRLDGAKELPAIDVQFGACRAKSDGHFFDIVDFRDRRIERWHTPNISIAQAERRLRRDVKPGRFTGNPDFFIKEMQSTHVVQRSRQGVMFVSRGNFLNGSSFTMIDTRSATAAVMIEDEGEEPYFYTATGGFAPDHRRWFFMRWPLSDSIAILNGETNEAHCEIGAVDVESGRIDIVHRLMNDDRIHQITPSPDGRYLLFTSFKSDMREPYPTVPPDQDPVGYRRSHDGGIIPKAVVTVDMRTWRHWQTEVPVPVSAHMEFDPKDPTAFFVSGHNFSINHQPNVIIEGHGAIIKMRIEDGRTRVVGTYAPGDLYRVSQHLPFVYRCRTVIAVTNTPNKLDLVDGETMTLWRREEMFPYAPLDFSATGSCIGPSPSKAFFSINPSTDGRFVVLESSESFHVYDTDEARFLDVTLPRDLPADAKGTGHTRIVGR